MAFLHHAQELQAELKKAELIAKHHHYAQQLQAELQMRGIQVSTRWPG